MKHVKRCGRCNKILNVTKEAHKVDDTYYCSKECAVSELYDTIVMSAKEQAIEMYNDNVEIVPVVDVCPICDKPLSECETIWAAAGTLYCSKDCGVYDFRVIHGMSAEEMFDMFAEELNPNNIGIGDDSNE